MPPRKSKKIRNAVTKIVKHIHTVHSFIDPIVRSGPDIELVIKRLDCKETIESTTITNKLRITKDTYTPLKLPNIVGEIIR
jgi:hypothetical protein